MPLQVRAITDDAGLAALEPEWAALDAALPIRMPFSSPAWSALWWRHFRRDMPKVRDILRVFAVRDAAGALVGVAPMMLTCRPGRGPLCMRELQFLGADQNVTELRGVVCQEQDEPAVLGALHRHLTQVQRDWDWVQWRGLRVPDPAAVLPGFSLGRQLVDLHIPLPGTWDALRARLPRNIKESIRKCRNSLARDGIAWTLDVITEPAALAAALDRLLALHRARSAIEGTVPHPDVFAAPAAQAFIAAYTAQAAARDGACMFALRVGDEHVALRLGFLMGRDLYLYYSGYDPAWGRYSVMTTVVAGAIEWAIGQGLGRVNLSTGIDVSKTRWRPERVTYAEGYQPAASVRGRVAFRMDGLVRGWSGHELFPRARPALPGHKDEDALATAE